MAHMTTAQRVALLPVFFVILLLGSEVTNHLLRDRDMAHAVQTRARLVEEINDIVHQLQRERGYSSGYLASEGRYLVSELTRERQVTDRVIATVSAAWARRSESLVPNGVRETLAQVPDWRADIDAARITTADALGHYTGLVNDLLELTAIKSIAVSRDSLPFLIETRQAIAQAKEAAGLQRAAGSMALGAHAMDTPLHQRFLSLAVREETFLDLAHLKAQAAERPLTTLKKRQFEQMEAVRQQLIAMGYGGAEPGVTAADWFAISSAWVDRLRVEENRLNAEIAYVSSVASENARDALILRGLAVLFAFALLGYQLMSRKRSRHHGYAETTG